MYSRSTQAKIDAYKALKLKQARLALYRLPFAFGLFKNRTRYRSTT